ncbi:hypothetical protein Tco_0505338 [Tanacetum coccineum]
MDEAHAIKGSMGQFGSRYDVYYDLEISMVAMYGRRFISTYNVEPIVISGREREIRTKEGDTVDKTMVEQPTVGKFYDMMRVNFARIFVVKILSKTCRMGPVAVTCGGDGKRAISTTSEVLVHFLKLAIHIDRVLESRILFWKCHCHEEIPAVRRKYLLIDHRGSLKQKMEEDGYRQAFPAYCFLGDSYVSLIQENKIAMDVRVMMVLKLIKLARESIRMALEVLI